MFDTLKTVILTNKVVFLRVDFNVPVDESGNVLDYYRIYSAVPTIRYLISNGAKIVVCTHFGRPKANDKDKFSVQFLQPILENIIGVKVEFCSQIDSQTLYQKIDQINYGECILLENIRFFEEEELADEQFSQNIARNMNIFVNEAFSCAHRIHSSTYKIANIIRPCAGFNFEKEVTFLDNFLSSSSQKNKTVSIIGGAKISTKIDVILSLIDCSDYIVLGGGMANTFLHFLGTFVGDSLIEKNAKEVVEKINLKANKLGCKIILPTDCVVLNNQNEVMTKEISQISPQDKILDISEKTIETICKIINSCSSFLVNGPLGMYEDERFFNGTKQVLLQIANQPNNKKSIIGGGDIVACVNKLGISDKFSFVSTAGGAFLEYIANKSLPCVDILKQRYTDFTR